MDFGGDIGLWQRKIAEGLEGTSRRLAVFEALAINSGQAVLDLGCGGGHLVRDIALAVGDSGRVVGLDASNEQIAAARSLCADLSAVELMEGDATNLPFEDASFDSLASIQMLEYVPDVDAAISEARRVMKPGSKASLVSVLWDHWRFHGADPELNNKMHEVWRKHCFHQMLPMEIPAKLEAAGFDGIVQKPIAFMNNTMHENAFSLWAAKLVAAFAVGNGVDEKEAAVWLEQLDTADTEGRFGFVSVPVLTTAIATSS
jgi:ubiquinone/menaquinone biosynthesis C-methylase UbiE